MSSLRVWSLPVTRDKALKLWHLLEYKLEPKEALDHLFVLLGHEELFDELEKAAENDDVRPFVRRYLKNMLWESPPCYRNAWQPEARQICKAAVYQQRLSKLS